MQAHACTQTTPPPPRLTLVLWPDTAVILQILQDPRGKDYLRTEGNGSIWHAHMVLKESPKYHLRLDPNPQKATK